VRVRKHSVDCDCDLCDVREVSALTGSDVRFHVREQLTGCGQSADILSNVTDEVLLHYHLRGYPIPHIVRLLQEHADALQRPHRCRSVECCEPDPDYSDGQRAEDAERDYLAQDEW
jgi:hypothetical protein